MRDGRTEEEKLRAKRVHAVVMMVLGAIMAVCALAAGVIAMRPGAFPSWMTGGRARPRPSTRVPAKPLVAFEPWSPEALARAGREGRLVLLHLTPFWSRDGRVMEETTYADPSVAEWVRARAVALRADPEESPELAARYGVGAWPTTALLLPDGRPVALGAYLTPGLFLPWARVVDQGLRERPELAESLAARTEGMLAAARAARSEPTDADWAAAAARREDPVWGGIYGGKGEAGSGGYGYEKTLADQARFVAVSTDAAAARRVLAFVERFMLLPAGYAASVRGEAEGRDGVIEGFVYFARDDAGRRAAGLPEADARLFPEPAAAMARATLASAAAAPAQKEHARLVLRRLETLTPGRRRR